MVHADNDRASGKKQQRLKERVRHQVKNRHGICRHSQGHGHITQLRQRRIRHHPLDIVLDDAQDTHEQGRDGANDQHKVQCCVTQFKQWRHARDHKDAGSHHGGRVDQRRDGRRAFH